MARPRAKGRLDWPPGLTQRTRGGKVYYYFQHSRLSKDLPLGTDIKIAKKGAQLAFAKLEMSAGDKVLSSISAYIEQANKPAEAALSLQLAFDQFMEEDMTKRTTGARLKKPRSKATLSQYRNVGNRFARENPDFDVGTMTHKQSVVWLSTLPETSRKNARALLIQFFEYAKKMAWRTDNPIENTFKPNPTVKSKRLTWEWYLAIHKKAPEWLQNVMDFALLTLQRREDLCVLQGGLHINEGRLFVAQQKVDRHGTGRLCIHIWPELQAVIDRCLTFPERGDCPYILSHEHERNYVSKGKHWRTHPNQLEKGYITKAFQKARDSLEVFQEMPEEERPPFREIRSLGGKLLKDRHKWTEAEVQQLFGHAGGDDEGVSMTKYYLSGYEGEEWVDVRWPARLAQVASN